MSAPTDSRGARRHQSETGRPAYLPQCLQIFHQIALLLIGEAQRRAAAPLLHGPAGELVDEPAQPRVGDRLQAVVCPELAVDVVQMVPERLGGDA